MRLSLYFLLFVATSQSCNVVSDCHNDILDTQSNKSYSLQLIAFTKNCGATASESFHLSIIPEGSSLANQDGNAFFVADGKSTHAAYQKAVSVRWSGENHIEVRFAKSLRVFRQGKSWGGVQIDYLPQKG